MGIGDGCIEVRCNHLSLHLLIDHPALQGLTEDDNQGLLGCDAVGKWLIGRLLLHPLADVGLHLGGERRLGLHALVDEVAKDGVHGYGASIVVGVLQPLESLLPSTSAHHLDGGDEKYDERGDAILLQSQGKVGFR